MIDPNRARRPLFRSPSSISDPFLVDWSDATGAVGCPTRWNSSSTGACAGGADVSVRQNFFARSLWRRAGRVRRRLGPAAGLGLGPQVPAAALCSRPTWPRSCLVAGEPARARRVRWWRDEAIERLRGGGHDEIMPAARAGLPGSGTQSCAIAARSHSAQLLAERATSARAVEVALRGHAGAGEHLAMESPRVERSRPCAQERPLRRSHCQVCR